MSRLRIQRCSGATRAVLLIGGLAVKFPHFGRGWRLGLNGLLANLQEREWHRADDRLCPVVWADPLGFMLVMRRCEPISEADALALQSAGYWLGDGEPGGCDISCLVSDHKAENFGKIDGRVVCLDYGS